VLRLLHFHQQHVKPGCIVIRRRWPWGSQSADFVDGDPWVFALAPYKKNSPNELNIGEIEFRFGDPNIHSPRSFVAPVLIGGNKFTSTAPQRNP